MAEGSVVKDRECCHLGSWRRDIGKEQPLERALVGLDQNLRLSGIDRVKAGQRHPGLLSIEWAVEASWQRILSVGDSSA